MTLRSHAFAISAGISLAGCITSSGLAQSDLPRPRAAPGEPKITSQRSSSSSTRYYFQRFADAGTYTVDEADGTISFLYHAFDGRSEDLPAQTVPVVCTINHRGMVLLNSCHGEDELSAEQRTALNIATVSGRDVAFPKYRALPDGFASFNRTVTLTLSIPAIAAPKVDLTTGPLVEPGTVDIDLNRLYRANSYPSRALRQEVEGDMLIECQIQVDLSVICRMTGFDPPQHAGLFAPTVNTMTRRMRPGALLKDGTDARGVRFPLRILWRIP